MHGAAIMTTANHIQLMRRRVDSRRVGGINRVAGINAPVNREEP
jgi:hypothetical protein